MNKELIDQLLHVLLGLSLVMLMTFPIPLYFSIPVAFGFIVVREVLQRLKAGMKWYDCQGGCRMDLAFGSLGILIATIFMLKGIQYVI